MREEGLHGRQKRRYRVRTTDSNHDEPIAANRLAQAPKPTQVNRIWVADITTYGPGKAGSTSRQSSISTAGRSSAGPWVSSSTPLWS